MDVYFFLDLICPNVVFYILFSMYHIASSTKFTVLRMDSHFDGYRCKPSDTVFELTHTNLLSCARDCFVNQFCYSVFYQQYLGACIGCDGFYHTSDLLNGSQYVRSYSGACSPDWIMITDQCYYVSPEKANWTYAQSECKRMGGGLLTTGDAVSYNSYHPMFQVVDLIDYWLDLVYYPENGTFIGTSTGTENVLGTSIRERASVERTCSYKNIDNSNWMFVSCQSAYHFICRRFLPDEL